MTYKEKRRSVANYGAPVWSTNASANSIGKIQIAQNEALRIATGSQKTSSIDLLHNADSEATLRSSIYVILRIPEQHKSYFVYKK